MRNTSQRAAVVLVAAAMVLGGQTAKSKAKSVTKTISGFITDSMCPTGDHSHMRMGENDRDCTIACVHSHGADYVLSDGKTVYVLAKQEQGEQFAGQKVTVVGKVTGDMIEVESIVPQKVKAGPVKGVK
jgi:hypothetical protein